jgi:hypothetical protein
MLYEYEATLIIFCKAYLFLINLTSVDWYYVVIVHRPQAQALFSRL